MSRKSKLLAALDAHKGRDHEAENRAKKAKATERKKRQKAESVGEEEGLGVEPDKTPTSGKYDESPSERDRSVPRQTEDSFARFSDDGKDDDLEGEVGENSPASEAGSDADVPLSDLSEEDRADTIPHQRMTINNTAALIACTKRVTVIRPKMKFSAHNSLVLNSLPPSSTSIPDPNNDLTRELEFYRICRTAAMDARRLLKKDKLPFTRPSDYFAEMVKSDEQMGKVKQKLYDEAANKKAAAEARRVRDAKKFGKAVQVAKEQERAKEKKQTLEKISILKRKRKGQDTGTVNERDDLFESIDVGKSSEKPSHRRKAAFGNGGDGGSKNNNDSNNGNKDQPGRFKRQKRDEKFGFGGKKRFSKSGDAVSTADMREFSFKKMKRSEGSGRGCGGARGGARGGGDRGGGSGAGREKKQRLGKSRRTSTGAR